MEHPNTDGSLGMNGTRTHASVWSWFLGGYCRGLRRLSQWLPLNSFVSRFCWANMLWPICLFAAVLIGTSCATPDSSDSVRAIRCEALGTNCLIGPARSVGLELR